VVIFPVAMRQCPWPVPTYTAWWTESWCMKLAKGRCMRVEGIESVNSRLLILTPLVYLTTIQLPTYHWTLYITCFNITIITQCNPWPHVANGDISGQLLSLWRHSHYDVIHYWAGHAQRYVYGRTYRQARMDTLPRLIYKDVDSVIMQLRSWIPIFQRLTKAGYV